MTIDAARNDHAPVPTPIVAGIQPQDGMLNRAYRPDGTDDWLIVGTCAGEGEVRARSGRHRRMMRGDLMLIRPGILHDYGFHGEHRAWRNVWVHFRPRPQWLDWLSWPPLDEGIAILSTGAGFGPIEAELHRIVEVSYGPGRLRVEAAMNALERLLILADDFNPTHGTHGMDDRIHRALVIIGERLADRLDIPGLSRTVGLSRSQFTALFTRQVGLSPQAYIEKERLIRASHLLRSANWSIAEVAAASGFSSPFYFSSRFSREFHLSPSAYRREQMALAAKGAAAEPNQVKEART